MGISQKRFNVNNEYKDLDGKTWKIFGPESIAYVRDNINSFLNKDVLFWDGDLYSFLNYIEKKKNDTLKNSYYYKKFKGVVIRINSDKIYKMGGWGYPYISILID